MDKIKFYSRIKWLWLGLCVFGMFTVPHSVWPAAMMVLGGICEAAETILQAIYDKK